MLLAVTCYKPKNANVSYLLRPARIHKSLIPFRICRLHGCFCSSLTLHAEKRQIRLVNNANTSLCDFKKSFTALFSFLKSLEYNHNQSNLLWSVKTNG